MRRTRPQPRKQVTGKEAVRSSKPGVAHLPPRRDYSSLSLRDLLEAREAFHVFLSTLDNVTATAIGRYRIHEDDWYASHAPDEPLPPNVRLPDTARTLVNSVVRPWSWPAILVFVRQWKQRRELGDQAIPGRVYLPDGRVIPTCVIEASPDESPAPPVMNLGPTGDMIGGG